VLFRTQAYWTEIEEDGGRVMAASAAGIGWNADSNALVLDGTSALTAGIAPAAPPEAWFDEPEAADPTPLTVTEEGHVFGHIALWGTCHTGLPGCRTPPKSTDDYRSFHLGVVQTAEGVGVPVGKITMATGHASLQLAARPALAHYDDTGAAVADVRAVDGRHGIWVSGAIRPDADAAQVRALRASPISGDWRKIDGQLRMVAALAVNVPGFPVPRQALAASLENEETGEYATTALVAAGVLTVERAQEAARQLAGLRGRLHYRRDMEALRARREALSR
jgi:hypothetical protein